MADTPKPVTDVEQDILNRSPENLRPEVQAVENEFNQAALDAASRSPEAEAGAAQVDPGLDAAARDAAAIASGKTVAAGALVNDANVVFKEVKAGYKTTEFWVAGAVIVLSQIGALDLPGHYGTTITTAAAAAAYVISRGLAK